ncbi:hypothetical protein [Erythrobacter alti]|uniref:hypothetical protein n=1 Tax=Erythrobacter alti TaxID=1896145 RepID=UPI0030F3C7F7
MMGRFLWWGLLAAVFVVASFAQLDRSSRFAPHLARFVPPAFSGFAAEQRTRQAIAAQQGERAIAEAEALVTARPLPAENLELLAIAAALSERNEQSIAAIEAASTRGWRAPIIQQAVAQAAIEQGNHDIAAQRISALLSIGEMREAALVLAGQLVATPDGQVALARRFAAPGHWQDNALRSLAGTVPPDKYSTTLVLAAKQGATLDCRIVERVIQNYVLENEDSAAARLREICPA